MSRRGPGAPSDTFDGHHAPGEVPWARGVRGLAGVAVLLVVLGHTAVPLPGRGSIGIDVLVVVLGFLLAGWALGDRLGQRGAHRLSGRRRRWVRPLVVVALLSSLAALWWTTTSTGRSTGLPWWHYGGRVLELASADAVGDPGLWAEDATWPAGSAVRTVAAVLALLAVCALIASAARRGMLRDEKLARRVVLVSGLTALLLVLAVALAVLRDVQAVAGAGTQWVLIAWRGWELAAGATVGYLAVHGSLPSRGSSPLTVLALVGMAAMAVTPGVDLLTSSAVAAGGACLVLVDLASGEPSAPAVVLLTRGAAPVVGIFGYAWYLWALPALVLAPVLLGETLSWHRSLEVVLLALWAAGLTHLVLGRRRNAVTARAVLVHDEPVHEPLPGLPVTTPAALHARRLAPPHAPGLGAFAGPRTTREA